MNKKKKKRISPGTVLIYAVLSFWALTTIYPIFWVIINSFKAKDKIMVDSFSLPLGELFTTANYRTAFDRLGIFTAYRNSLIISCTVAAVVILLAGMAAFALVRYHFRLRGALMSVVVAGMMFPVFSTIIPVYQMQSKMGITATDSLFLNLLCVILPQIAGNLSFAIVVLTGYIKSLPIELEEAAYMEGSHCFTGGASGYHRIRVPSEIHHQRNDGRSGKGVIPIISERQFISIRKARGCLCSVVSIFRENPFFSFFFGQKEV